MSISTSSCQLGAKDQSSPAINLQNFELLYIRTKSLHSTPQLTTHIYLNLVWDNPTSYFCVRMCAVGLKIANYFRNRSCCTQYASTTESYWASSGWCTGGYWFTLANKQLREEVMDNSMYVTIPTGIIQLPGH